MGPIRFGLIGEYQSGKSLLTNCLLKRSIATVGKGAPTTHTVVNYQYGEDEYVKLLTIENKSQIISIDEFRGLDTSSDIIVADVYIKNDFLRDFILTDIPGYGANNSDNERATEVLLKIDFAIVIASSDKSFGAGTDSFRSLCALKKYRIPYYFLLNCTNTDRWRCDDEGNINIAIQNNNLLAFYPPSKYPLRDDGLNIVNLMWYWYSICESEDELINRRTNKLALLDYGIEPSMKDQLREVSGFDLIKKIFSMENRGFLEIRQTIRDEINALRKELCPVGTIQAFATNNIPNGWLICDGSSLSINEYPDLYWAIGHLYGIDGENRFLIPDLQGRFIRGWDKDGKNDENRSLGSYQDDTFQNHSHNFDPQKLRTDSDGSHTHTTYGGKHDVGSWGGSISTLHWLLGDSGSDTGSTSSAGSHWHFIKSTGNAIKDPCSYNDVPVHFSSETRPKNVALIFCIKAFDSIKTTELKVSVITTSKMKSPGEGVYECFLAVNGPIRINSDIDSLRLPIQVEYHNEENNEISIKRINHGDSLYLPKDGVYFLRFSNSECKNRKHDCDLLEIFPVHSVGIIGSFNNWETAIDLNQISGILEYEIELTIPVGRHEFKYQINNAWEIALGGDSNNLSSWLGDNLYIDSNGEKIKFHLSLQGNKWKSIIL